MPFINSPERQIALSKAIGSDELGTSDEFTFREKLRAAYRLENTIGSFLAKNGNLPDSKVTNPDFNPIDFLTEQEKLDDRFLSHAVLADNTDEIDSLRDQFNREAKDRAALQSGGFLPTMISAVSDPINMIPVGGAAYKSYRAGSNIYAAAAVTAGAAVAATTATEAGLHYSQIQRTYGESAVNVSASAILGGILGATPVGVRKMLEKAGHEPDQAFKEIDHSFYPEKAISEGGNPSLSVGSAQAEAFTDINVKGVIAKVLTKALGFDPLSRTITSDEQATRVLSSRLVENPITMDRNIGTSVETKIKVKTDGFMVDGIESHLDIYKQYRLDGGKMTRKEFGEDVGRAIRNGSDNTFVQKAADEWNARVYEPIKKASIEAKLLPEDVDVTTAKGYLNRVWNKEKVVANAAKFNQITSEWLVRRNPELDIEDAKDLAREIMGRIASSPDGRLPYDYKIGENIAKGSRSSALKGPFKKRSFSIEDNLVEDFLENDIEILAQKYVKNTIPDIEIVKEFGDVNLTAELKTIESSWNKRIEGAKSRKEALSLKKRRDGDRRDIEAMLGRMRNTYNIADHDNPWVRVARVARDLNYMRLLGGVVAASITDVARIVMAEGIVKVFSAGLKPLVSSLSTFKMAAKEAKLAGVGSDALMRRAEVLADVADYSQGGTAFERGVRSAATKFSSINLMNQWTAGIKQLHAVMMQTRVSDDLMKGRYDARLGQLGIREDMVKDIAGQMKKYGNKIDGVFVANTKDWDRPDLVEVWRGAMRKESDRVIIVPGQERPLFMSTEMGKTIFQFKTFMFSATQRILISGLQGQDKYMFQGMLSMVSLGAMTYAFKQWDAGREISDDPMVLVMEGIDRSGAIGIIMEANNTLEKVSANNIGLRPILGISQPASRYASRSALDSMVGPTFGLSGDILKAFGAATDGYEWSDSDTRTLRRLIPGQNLSFIRQGFDKLEKEVSK